MPRMRPLEGVQIRELDERFALSYQPKAPDHGRPELALADRRPFHWRYAVLAVGEEATQLWNLDTLPDEVLSRGRNELANGGEAA